MTLADDLAVLDRVALNVERLEGIFSRLQEMLPNGSVVRFGGEIEASFDELGRTWEEGVAALPAIDGWRIDARIVPYGELAAAHHQSLEFSMPEVGFSALQEFDQASVQLARYKLRLQSKRRSLGRQHVEQRLSEIDAQTAGVAFEAAEVPDDETTRIRLQAIETAFSELERLLGDDLSGAPRLGDLRRHLHFAAPHDLRDIAHFDWPAVRSHIERIVYTDDDVLPVAVEDLASLGGSSPATAIVPARIQWERLDPDGLELLITRLLQNSPEYVQVNRLMNVNAPDNGRDIEAYRVVQDTLIGEQRERVIIQVKHQQSGSVTVETIANLIQARLTLWEGEPIRRVIFATSGTFTQDAVRWMEQHNRDGRRPVITLWSGAELESLVRGQPALLAEFGLID